MRRSDREIRDVAEIVRVIEKCDVCRLGLSDNTMPYVVPLNFGYEFADGKLTLYFHGAKEGKKLDIIKSNPSACFEMDCCHRLIEADEACKYTMEYESVIGRGTVSLCFDGAEKIKALKQLMKTYTKDRDFDFPQQVVESLTVFKLEVSDVTGKRLRKH